MCPYILETFAKRRGAHGPPSPEGLRHRLDGEQRGDHHHPGDCVDAVVRGGAEEAEHDSGERRPAIIATLRCEEFRASAFVRSCAGTMLGTIAERAGFSRALNNAKIELAT